MNDLASKKYEALRLDMFIWSILTGMVFGISFMYRIIYIDSHVAKYILIISFSYLAYFPLIEYFFSRTLGMNIYGLEYYPKNKLTIFNLILLQGLRLIGYIIIPLYYKKVFFSTTKHEEAEKEFLEKVTGIRILIKKT